MPSVSFTLSIPRFIKKRLRTSSLVGIEALCALHIVQNLLRTYRRGHPDISTTKLYGGILFFRTPPPSPEQYKVSPLSTTNHSSTCSRSPTGSLSANLGRLDGQVLAIRDPVSGTHQRFGLWPFERLGFTAGSGVRRRHPHNTREVGQRDKAMEGTRLFGNNLTCSGGRCGFCYTATCYC